MSLNRPTVSIIMATYNRGHFIKSALDSIQDQSYANWECIIIDDGSTDNTKEFLSDFTKQDARFKYFERPSRFKKGLPGSRNYGLELASGDFYVFFDDDDVVHPQNLEINVNLLETNRLFKFCRYDKQPFFSAPPVLNKTFINWDFKYTEVDISNIDKVVTGEISFASCTVLWNKECFLHDNFNEDLQYAEEWELYTRILSKGFKGLSINETLYYNRKHPQSNTGQFWANQDLRMDSKVEATRLVFDNLKNKGLLSEGLVKYFIRLSIFLKKPSLLRTIVEDSNLSNWEKLKYRVGYKFYPLLRPIFILKDKIMKLNLI